MTLAGQLGITIAAEDPRTAEIIAMIAELDAFSFSLYPPESCHHTPPEVLAEGDFLVARADGLAIGCGALVPQPGYGELKRMYVRPQARGQRLGDRLIAALAGAALARCLPLLRLETGIRNHSALALYRRHGFVERGPFGDYGPDPTSVFMERRA